MLLHDEPAITSLVPRRCRPGANDWTGWNRGDVLRGSLTSLVQDRRRPRAGFAAAVSTAVCAKYHILCTWHCRTYSVHTVLYLMARQSPSAILTAFPRIQL